MVASRLEAGNRKRQAEVGDVTDGRQSVVDYWNQKYGGQVHAEDLEPVLRAARAHFGDVRGKRVLDLGCGLGVASIHFAGLGAEVVSVDMSAVAVQRLRDTCADNGIVGVRAEVASAMEIGKLGPFDRVFGSMILHHIEPFDEFARVLGEAMAPEGRAFFYENNGRSRLLLWFRDHVVGRFGVPKHGDNQEFPLQPEEIDMLRPSFEISVEFPELRFFRLISAYLLRGHLGRLTGALDAWCYDRGLLNRYSYRQFVKLTKKPSPR
jgi:2-polyprenyl-3-methyl-5-hydroxy-6-metoxy-1,4-benzoquinol methylase